MVPEVWQAEYEKTKPLPSSVRTLLTDLEDIEASEKVKARQDPPNQSKKDGKRVNFSGKEASGKAAKKARKQDKYCDRCKKYGGAHTTHNTGDCKKYEQDGTRKKSFKAEKQDHAASKGKKNFNFAQMEKKMNKMQAKINKLNKKKGKHGKKRKREYYYSSDSDSDSS